MIFRQSKYVSFKVIHKGQHKLKD